MRERAARLLERLLDLLGIATRKSCEGFVIVALAPVSVAVFCGSLVRGLFCRLSIYVDFYRHWVERRPPLQYQ